MPTFPHSWIQTITRVPTFLHSWIQTTRVPTFPHSWIQTARVPTFLHSWIQTTRVPTFLHSWIQTARMLPSPIAGYKLLECLPSSIHSWIQTARMLPSSIHSWIQTKSECLALLLLGGSKYYWDLLQSNFEWGQTVHISKGGNKNFSAPVTLLPSPRIFP